MRDGEAGVGRGVGGVTRGGAGGGGGHRGMEEEAGS